MAMDMVEEENNYSPTSETTIAKIMVMKQTTCGIYAETIARRTLLKNMPRFKAENERTGCRVIPAIAASGFKVVRKRFRAIIPPSPGSSKNDIESIYCMEVEAFNLRLLFGGTIVKKIRINQEKKGYRFILLGEEFCKYFTQIIDAESCDTGCITQCILLRTGKTDYNNFLKNKVSSQDVNVDDTTISVMSAAPWLPADKMGMRLRDELHIMPAILTQAYLDDNQCTYEKKDKSVLNYGERAVHHSMFLQKEKPGLRCRSVGHVASTTHEKEYCRSSGDDSDNESSRSQDPAIDILPMEGSTDIQGIISENSGNLTNDKTETGIVRIDEKTLVMIAVLLSNYGDSFDKIISLCGTEEVYYILKQLQDKLRILKGTMHPGESF